MLARDLFRNDPERIRTMLAERHTEANLDRLLEVDASWRDVLVQVEELKARRNAGSKEIGGLYREGRQDQAEELKTEMSTLGEEIKDLEGRAKGFEAELGELELQIPNLFDESVPVGVDEDANRVERIWGEHPEFDFEPKAHWDLGPELGMVDFERAAKIASSRFAVLRGKGAALERALISYMLDVHTGHHGYTEIIPPYLVNSASLFGTGQLPKFADDLFRVKDFDLYLVPTAEVPLTNLHRDETLDESELPVRYCASTPCFRAEAGSHGRDVRGLIRQHQFHKVELVQFVRPEESWDRLEELCGHAEAVLQGLELPYRVVTLASGDLGFSAAKTYDLEVWLPALGCYREISSCTNFTDFQARRAHLRFRPSQGGKSRHLHTLNGSGLAAGRTMVAVLENYQQADGSVVVPDVLRPYMGGLEVIEPQ
ncbi:MAG: serine--tRNA ligase [Acidobacteria bacterium]|uniref:Serine--tRNA ligase n=1 Tax=Candidatus Sulfomarinibacter kjeldsenii TaxID=2885994 RepID=A0A8J6Y4V8_9BACT|nr:serine--tRNA ligase [Candidatus Sulfomarinibacter kjeldsenii]